MPVILIKLIVIILPGTLAGFIAGRITESKNGFLMSVISGVVGACPAVWLFGLIKKR